MSGLLTDEFVEFTKKIADLMEQKKAIKDKLKIYYENAQAEIQLLEQEAAVLHSQFQKVVTEKPE